MSELDAREPLAFTRRGFLKSSGGLVISFSLLGRANDLIAATDDTGSFGVPPAGQLYAWLAVHPDNRATLFTGKVDTGTGTQTALAQIAAEELDFPVERLDVVMGTTSQTVDQGPSYGSLAIRMAGPQIRHAAAAGRAVLLDLAAKHFRVPTGRLIVREGLIEVNGVPDRKITYGELVDGRRLDFAIGASGEQFDMKVAPSARTKDPHSYTVVGRSVPRKDIPAKVTAAFTYVQDLRVPGMLHGRIVRPYGIGAHLREVHESGLSSIPGFVRTVRREDFLGVVAETEWAAIQAAAQLGSTLQPSGPNAGRAKWSDWNGLPEMDQIWETVRKASGRDIVVAKHGSVDAALARAARKLKATYLTPYQMHGSIGPSCAVADVKADRAILWSGTQMPHETRRDIAKVLGMPLEHLELRWCEASGGYGRNGLDHVVADAAIMSQIVGRPVRVQWMRWDEHGWEPKGPPIVQDLSAGLDARGRVIGWRHHVWVPTLGDTHLIAAALIGNPAVCGETGLGDPSITYEYTFPSADVIGHCEGRVGLLTAWLRSPGQFETTFAMESFIDELAAAAREDPLAFRLSHVKDARALAVLKAAADRYGWKSRPVAAGQGTLKGRLARGRGIAWVNRDGARVATIADVSVDTKRGVIRVERVVVAHDCGLVVNPDGVRNQVEGNLIQSLSRTLHEEVTFDRAHVTSRDWAGYPILRFEEIPDSIEIVLVNNSSEYPSLGAGEPSTCPTAAVIGNAVFDAIGVRLRQTPFRPERVHTAMRSALEQA